MPAAPGRGRRRAGAALLGLALALPARADVPPALDAGAPAGAELTARTDAPHDRYELPVGPFGGEARPVRPLEGRVVRSAWRVEDAALEPEGAVAEYRERLAARGFEPVFACHDRECGGFDFRFGVELMPAPAMLMDTADFAQLSMTAPDGRFASVLASRVLDSLHVQTVMVEGRPAASAPATAAPSTPEPPPAADAPDPAAPAPPPAGGLPLEQSLATDGRAVIEGLAFAPGGAELTEESAPALDRLATLLAERPEQRFALVGHSDNVGGLDGNIALSRRRAEAVRAALISRGVASGRLEAHGAGWLAPLASNATEAGRRLNRRVEIVAR